MPARSLADFLALAKAQPDALSFGTSGIGGTSHLATEMLMAMAGISMLHVPYRGGGPAAQALLTGETKVTFVDLITALPFIAQRPGPRSRHLHHAPRRAGAGCADHRGGRPAGLRVLDRRASSPRPARRTRSFAAWARRCGRALASPETRQQIVAQGAEPVGSTPEEFAEYWPRETAKWGAIVRSRGIRMG